MSSININENIAGVSDFEEIMLNTKLDLDLFFSESKIKYLNENLDEKISIKNFKQRQTIFSQESTHKVISILPYITCDLAKNTHIKAEISSRFVNQRNMYSKFNNHKKEMSRYVKESETYIKQSDKINEIKGIEIFYEIEYEINKVSAGEKKLIDFYVELKKGIEIIQDYPQEGKKILLLLDEPDTNLHPEWSRNYLTALIIFLNKYEKLEFQIIMTTHSPFTISDLLEEQVVLLEEEVNSLNVICKNELDEQTGVDNRMRVFGDELYDLLDNEFFLEKFKGENSIRVLRKVRTLIANKILNEEGSDEKLEKYGKQVEQIVESIGDDYLRQQYQNMLSLSRSNVFK